MAANGGTLFLNEIGELPLTLQAKLLGCLEEKRVVRIGDTVARPVDFPADKRYEPGSRGSDCDWTVPAGSLLQNRSYDF